MTFLLFVIYPLTLHANDSLEADIAEPIDTSLFDEMPIDAQEVSSVTKLFWSAQSIQDEVRKGLPENAKKRFTQADGCDVKAVTKTEGSADTCELNDDPTKNAKYIYNFNVACTHGTYQISICSRQEAKLLNQLKVLNPEKLVSEDNPFDLDSTM